MPEINPIFQQFIPKTPIHPIQSDKKEQNQKKSYASKIAFSLLGVSVFGLFVATGVRGGYHNRILKIAEKLRKKIYKKTTGDVKTNALDNVIIKVQKSMLAVLKFLHAISNITPIKDTITMKLLNSTELTRKFAQKINKVFKKIAVSSSRKAYEKAFSSFDRATAYMIAIEKGKSKDLGFLVKEAHEYYQANFFAHGRNLRLEEIKSTIKGLDKKLVHALYDRKEGAIYNPREFKTYITFKLIQKEKTDFYQRLLSYRRKLTNENYHKIQILAKSIDDMKAYVHSEDSQSQDLIKSVFIKAMNFETAIEKSDKNALIASTKEMNKLLDELRQSFLDFKYENKSYVNVKLNSLIGDISSIKGVINSHEKGYLQKGLDIVEGIYGKDSAQYKKTQRMINEFSRLIDKAIEREGIGLYEKLTEIEVGSAPTDVLGLMIPALFAVYLTMRAEGKEEKISTALQASIPIIGGVGTAFYGTIRMFTGIQNLTLAIVSGLTLNIFGNWINKAYKSSIAKKQNDIAKDNTFML